MIFTFVANYILVRFRDTWPDCTLDYYHMQLIITTLWYGHGKCKQNEHLKLLYSP